jgi:hypothetical protein
MLFIASVLLLTACIASPATNAISYEIPKDGHFDIIVSQGNVRQATANQIQRRAVAEKDSGIICENNRKFTKVWGSYKWLQRKKITNDHSTLNFPWEQTVAWEISTSRSEMTSIATENSQTTSISIGVEASANLFFGSASVSSDFSYAATQVTTAVRESSSTTTVTKSESETFKLDIPPGVTVYIYEGILQFPGKDFSSTELRLTDQALPDREEVFMKIPITVAGEHQGCVCGTGFGNKSCPNADECCSRVIGID